MTTVPYADTDFLMALLKPKDWLKEPAEELLKKHHGNLWASAGSVIEVLLLCDEYNLDAEDVIVSLYELVDVHVLPRDIALAAAHLVKKGLRVFDAFHAAYATDDAIISSDDIFDKAGLKRIPLG